MVAVGKKRNGMIDKTIICLSARANSGKTTSIRELFFRLTGHYPESTGDFLSIVQDKNVEHGIGISSVGDSWGNREPIEKLIDAGCEIIGHTIFNYFVIYMYISYFICLQIYV